MFHRKSLVLNDVDDLIFVDESWNFSQRLERRGNHAGRRGLFLFLGEPMGRAKDDLAAIDDP